MATEEEKQKFVANITAQIDAALNGPALPGIDNKKVAFVLMILPMGAPTNVNCTITANGLTKEYVADLLKTQAALLLPPEPAPPVN